MEREKKRESQYKRALEKERGEEIVFPAKEKTFADLLSAKDPTAENKRRLTYIFEKLVDCRNGPEDDVIDHLCRFDLVEE